MLTLAQFAEFLVAVAIIELTPGPNMAYLAIVTGRAGPRAGLVTVAGVTFGLATYLVATLGGAARLAVIYPWIFHTLRWAGVAYIVWLAIDTWRDRTRVEDIQTAHLFRRGLVANLLNPKAAVFYVAILPAFIREDGAGPVAQAAALGAIHLAVSLTVHVGIVLAASGARARLGRRGGLLDSRITRRGFALALIAVAVWLAISTGGQLT